MQDTTLNYLHNLLYSSKETLFMSEEMRLGEYAWDHVSVDNRQADRILESPNTHSAQRVVQTENPLGEKK